MRVMNHHLNGDHIRKCDSCRVVTIQSRCDAGDEYHDYCSDCEPKYEPN
jgi:predicted RNA-binding protein with PUA domain